MTSSSSVDDVIAEPPTSSSLEGVEPPDPTFGIMNDGPSCLAIVDGETYVPIKVNDTFERHMGEIYKFQSSPFWKTAVSEDDNAKHQILLKETMDSIWNPTTSGKTKATARNVEMITLGKDNSGFPIKRHVDWTVTKTIYEGQETILLVGDLVTEQSIEERERDQELIDFFQNAPIALHWLGGDGKVMWCNQTELNVLGYTAEEYIGQPIMKFCPDEEELVLEIFKSLGSGNTIRDVPVRFRTKDGRLVHLLIDSNVKYDKHGQFGHTRCFIRDDTGRKINEAKSRLLLEETKRSLKMLDNFMSRSLHHMRTPLHVLQTVNDMVLLNAQKHVTSGNGTPEDVESLNLLQDGQAHIQDAVELLDDISDLAKFDQGVEYIPSKDKVNLKELGLEVFKRAFQTSSQKIRVSLDLRGGGPAIVETDSKALKRILKALVDHAMQKNTQDGEIKMTIWYQSGRCTLSVEDHSSSSKTVTDANSPKTDVISQGTSTGGAGTLPPIFQRYHQEMLPNEEDMLDKTLDIPLNFQQAMELRSKVAEAVSSHKQNSLGIGLSLSYHLVMALGGDLRYDNQKFWFALPAECSTATAMTSPTLPCEIISKDGMQAKLVTITTTSPDETSTTTASSSSVPPAVMTVSTTESNSITMQLSSDASTDDGSTTVSFADDATASVDGSTVSGESAAKRRSKKRRPTKRFFKDKKGSSIGKKTGGNGDETMTDVTSTTEDESTQVIRKEEYYSSITDMATNKKRIVDCGANQASSNPSVLVVEDTDACAKLLKMMLTKMNCSSVRAENGKVAVDLVKHAMPGMYDLILMDLRMPVMDGLEATRILKNEIKTKIPIVALTGEIGNDIRQQCADIGFDDFHNKPMKRAQLKAVIDKFCTGDKNSGEEIKIETVDAVQMTF